MAVTHITESDRWFDIAKEILAAPRCSVCGEPVRVRAEYATVVSTRWVIPVDDEGRCPSCAWEDR